MAKIKKSTIKLMIKECILELLVDGIPSELADLLKERREHGVGRAPKTPRRSIQQQQQQQFLKEDVDPEMEERLTQRLSGITDDPIMANILRNTAKTTLQEQQQRGSPMQHQNADAPVNLNDFPSSHNWGKLAELDNKKK